MSYIKSIAHTAPGAIYVRLAELSEREKKNEHKKNVEQFKSGSNIAKHAWKHDHKINFDDCKIIDKATLESWHTATALNSDNNVQHLPEQYRFLLKK